MKLFLDRNKTLLPRVDVIYLFTRVMTLLGIGWFTFLESYPSQLTTLFYVILGTFSLHLVVFYTAVKGRFDIKLAYLSAIIYDIILVPTLVMYTGGLYSPFYPLLFLTIAVAAYVLQLWFATAVTGVITVIYLTAILDHLTLSNAFPISLRIGFLLVFYLAISYASDYMRRSEGRLLRLFDTLNRRTSELEKSQAQLEMIYENSRILTSILDSGGVIREVMRILGNVLQYSNAAIILRDRWGKFYYRARLVQGRKNLLPRAIDAGAMDLAQKVCDHGEPVRIKNVSGREDHQPLSESSRSLMVVPLTSHGLSVGVLTAEADRPDYFTERDLQMLSIVARSAALALENARLHNRMEELTIIDELTETFNYRFFIQKLHEEKRRAARYNLPLSLIMVDIDHFKKLNDTYGHEHGNIVLKQLAGIIKGCIRDVDIFARYGGEEFAIILPQTAQAEATVIGERIRQQVETTAVHIGNGQTLHVTVSVGVTSYPENGKSEEELVSVADQALYRAKGEGRNLVRVI
ncbi:MAG: sensor domain-containing diguanylate cyclase [Candidatus Zixiibacteriota bacterium]